ncbi:TELO2-interacting protein 1 homolog [Bolinopsis microptera]|uniref:TELO2-interacting protein 1 homolog n=1 Tax=Bolinopsis microptera TaxID=2820187 RepID=UPI0030793750
MGTEVEKAAKTTFLQLRPICSAAANIPNVANFTALLTALEDVEIENAPQLVQYILFPMMVVIQKHNTHPTQVKEAAVKCLLCVVRKVNVTDTSVFLSVFDNVSSMIFPSEKTNFSDELIHLALQVMLTMFQEITEPTLCQLCTVERLPFAGHMIAIALTYAHKCASKDVKLTALQFLQIMFDKMSRIEGSEVKEETEQYWTHISGSDLLASLLPGIVTMLVKIITEPNKYSEVQARSVGCLETFISLTLNQRHYQTSIGESFQSLLSPEIDSCPFTVDDFRKDPAVILAKRDAVWWRKTVLNVQPLIHRMISTLSSEKGCVRIAVAKFLRTCIRDSMRPLHLCMDNIIGMLLCILDDDDEEVSEIAKEGLTIVSKDNGLTLVSIVTDALQDITLKLPTIVLASCEDKMIVLKQLRNLVCLLGENVHVVLNSESHWIYIEQMFMKMLEIDPQEIRIEDLSVLYPEYSAVSISDTNCKDTIKADLKKSTRTIFAFKEIRFQNVENKGLLNLILDIVNVMGYLGNIDALVNSFMEKFLKSKGRKVQSLIIVSDLLWGAKGHVSQRAKSLCPTAKVNAEPLVIDTAEEVLHTLLDSPLFNDSQEPNRSVKEIRQEKLLHSLMLYCMRGCFRVLGKYAHRDLIRALYPVLNKLGSTTPLVSEAAFVTVQGLCREFNSPNIGFFLKQNADYVINTACLNMRYLDLYPSTTRVLQVLIKHSSKEALPPLQDCLHEITACIAVHQRDEHTIPLFKLLKIFMLKLEDWFPDVEYTKDELYSIKELGLLRDDIRVQLDTLTPNEFNKAFVQYFNLNNEDEQNVFTGEGEEDDEKKLPLHLRTCKTITEVAIQNLTCTQADCRVSLLQTICTALRILSKTEDELLPLVHKVWWHLEKRLLSDYDFHVKLEALKVLQTIAKVSGSFIKQRVSKDLLPSLLSSLEPDKVIVIPKPKEIPPLKKPISFEELKRMTIKHAQETKSEVLLTPRSVQFKVQQRVLKTLAVLTTYLKFHDRDLYRIIGASYKYLHKDMPNEMQRYALYLYRALVGVNPDLMWVVFHSLGGIQTPIHDQTPMTLSLFPKPPPLQTAGYKKTCSECLYGLRTLNW